jgi:hypothetical protein
MNAERSGDQNSTVDDTVTWSEAREYTRRHAVIEQAKGMLMFVYGIDDDDAFSVRRTQSQDHNVKLGLIAEQVGTWWSWPATPTGRLLGEPSVPSCSRLVNASLALPPAKSTVKARPASRSRTLATPSERDGAGK